MTSLIRSARVYNAHLPTPDAMAQHLAERPFVEIRATEERSVGFVPIVGLDSGELVARFHGGYAFAVRIDRKVVPGAAVKAEVNRLVDLIEATTGRAPGKKERKQIKEDALLTLLPRAFPRTAVITGFFHEESRFLFLNTTSQGLSDIVMTELVHAASSVKTETIHVSGVKQGLTTRLQAWANLQEPDEGAFGDFTLVDRVSMASEHQRIAMKLDGLDAGVAAIKEALQRNFQVTSIRLQDAVLSFDLTHDFLLKGIDSPALDDGADEQHDAWLVQANYEVLVLVDAMKKLCSMFSTPQTAESGDEFF